MKENKKTNILSTILVFGLLIIFFGYKYSNKVEYLCLKDNTYKDTKITKDMITKCTSRGRTKEKYITKEYDIVGKCLNTNKRKERLIYPSDIEICSEDRDITTIELTDELNYYNHLESTSDKEIYYTFYVKNNMLYVKGNNKDDKLLFNQEKVDKIVEKLNTSNAKVMAELRKRNIKFESNVDIIAETEAEQKFGTWLKSQYPGYYESHMITSYVPQNDDMGGGPTYQGNGLTETKSNAKKLTLVPPKHGKNSGFVSWYGIVLTLILALALGYSIAYVIWNYLR